MNSKIKTLQNKPKNMMPVVKPKKNTFSLFTKQKYDKTMANSKGPRSPTFVINKNKSSKHTASFNF